jgi:TPR repeat protein
MKRFDIILTALTLGFFGLLFASYPYSNKLSDLDKAIIKLKAGDFSVIRSHMIPLAENGDTRAQFDLGVAYMLGHGVKQSFPKSFYWTKKAALAGDTRAQVNLANLYTEGKGVDKDIKKGIKWYIRAANAGDEFAMLALGKIYRDGIIIPRDYNQSHKFFALSAEMGNLEAKAMLAEFYLHGWGVGKDVDRATSIYSELDKKGYKLR